MGRQEQTNHLFSNRDLRILLVPLIVEQILNSLMGTADSIMVSNVGSAAISAVSLVDSINILVIQAFYALAAGGTIVCSQYIGQKDKKNAEESARQLSFCGGVHLVGGHGSLPSDTRTAAAADFRQRRGGCHGGSADLFLLHGSFVPIYRPL
ncbi:MAG: MATE family efflux transporter [Clostridium fessum]